MWDWICPGDCEGKVSIQFDALEAMLPEAVESLKERYRLLECISLRQPIGRRTLALECGMTERRVRSETEIMYKSGLVEIYASGMCATQRGAQVLKELGAVMHNVLGFEKKEKLLAESLGIKRVVISKGDIEATRLSMETLGRSAATVIENYIQDGDTIAVTGGSTLRCVADSFNGSTRHSDIKVVPGRGGIGTNPEIQSNTIASVFADKLNAKTDILYLPDMLNPRIARTIMREPNIKKIMAAIKNVDMLIFGIGVADEMAHRRGLSKPITDMIAQRGAVGEAFGYYFNENGEIVYLSHTIGITLDEMKGIDRIIGVAGGAKKAKAILSVIRNIKNTILVTDESAANEMCSLLGLNI